MKNITKSPILSVFIGVCAFTMLSDSSAFAQSRYGAPNQNYNNSVNYNPHHVVPAGYARPVAPKKYKGLAARIRNEKHIAYQIRPPHPGPGQFQRWVNWEPEYTLTPGDQLDIVVSSAPELSRTLTVGPDGRVVMPMSRPIMAAGRTLSLIHI